VFNGVFNNEGVLTKSGGSGTLSFDRIPFRNDGTTNVQRGTLDLAGGGSSSGTFFAGSGASLTFSAGAFTFGTGTRLAGPGTSRITGAAVVVDGAVEADHLDLASGSLSGTGSLIGSLTNTGGQTKPGAPLGTLEVRGDYTQTGGALAVDLGGSTSCTAFGRLDVDGPVRIGGTLNVTLRDGCRPQSGQRFEVLSGTSLSGQFSQLSLPPGLHLELGLSRVTLVADLTKRGYHQTMRVFLRQITVLTGNRNQLVWELCRDQAMRKWLTRI